MFLKYGRPNSNNLLLTDKDIRPYLQFDVVTLQVYWKLVEV